MPRINAEMFEFSNRQRRYMHIKSAADFIAALFVLVILIVPFWVIILIQKITAPHEPIFFLQDRIGQHGKVIRIIKLRSMTTGNNITRFGQFLRDTSIDELPQLINVLSGEMSLIGPRPLIPEEKQIHELRNEYGIYRLRPGITGWAQINGRDSLTAIEKASYDREYMENIGFLFDMRILLGTIKSLLVK